MRGVAWWVWSGRLRGSSATGSLRFLRENAKIKYHYVTKSQERLEIDTLGDAGILKHTKKFFTTIIKLKTKLL